MGVERTCIRDDIFAEVQSPAAGGRHRLGRCQLFAAGRQPADSIQGLPETRARWMGLEKKATKIGKHGQIVPQRATVT